MHGRTRLRLRQIILRRRHRRRTLCSLRCMLTLLHLGKTCLGSLSPLAFLAQFCAQDLDCRRRVIFTCSRISAALRVFSTLFSFSAIPLSPPTQKCSMREAKKFTVFLQDPFPPVGAGIQFRYWAAIGTETILSPPHPAPTLDPRAHSPAAASGGFRILSS